MKRPICTACNRQLVAINYIKENKTHYRTRCDRFNFRAKSGAQILVYHMDGNLNNVDLTNLRNVCLNCTVEITRLDLPWRVGDLVED